MTRPDVAVLGTGMTDLSRRDLSPDQLAHQAVTDALADARIDPAHLGLVLFANAMGGRLCDQGCVRGQSWMRKLGLGDTAVVNVDNSCAGGSSVLHLGVLAARASDQAVLVVGVEKMWTGDRAATLAGIEDGLPADYRADMRARLAAEDNPSGSMLMALNAAWARQHMTERGSSIEQVAAAAVKARHNAARNPRAQVQRAVTLEEVLAAPSVAGVLTRPMCSSFTDGAAAIVLSGVPGGASGASGGARGRTSGGAPGGASSTTSDTATAAAPRIIGSVGRSGNGTMDYHDRLEETSRAAWEEIGIGPREFDMVELHDATSAEELFALESLGFFDPGDAGPATLAGDTAVGGKGLAVNPSGGLVGRGHPLAATGLAQVIELADQLRGRAGDRQVAGARLGVAINTGGVIEGDAAYVGVHALAAAGA